MKIHLRRHNRAACGLITDRTTRQPHQVTCLSCQRTLAMADAEAREANKRSTRRVTRPAKGKGKE